MFTFSNFYHIAIQPQSRLHLIRAVFYRLIPFLMISTAAFGQQVIHGRVVDQETGLPIPFASVGILGTSKGTSSNLNGEFQLSADAAVTIKISCIGYESKTLSSSENVLPVYLKPLVTQLNEIVIFKRSVNARRVVMRAFANRKHNYPNHDFLQKFFYRHYCKDDHLYGRLIEASVDVWKHNGYRQPRKIAGEREEIRVTQLRRSIDNTFSAQGHAPISIGNILQADMVGYQSTQKSPYIKFYDEVNNLHADFDTYAFEFDGTTTYDGHEVHIITYSHKPDSILTTTGYQVLPGAYGTLYISTDRYAFIRMEDTRHDGVNIIRTKVFYRKYDDRYYPYHLLREGENHLPDNRSHSFHIELMSVELQTSPEYKFTGQEPGKEELLNISYDSTFWKSATILKTTPLEDNIIDDLGRGLSLHEQFSQYKKYEWSTNNGGLDGESKFDWLREFSKDKKLLYVVFWNGRCDLACLQQLEEAKKIQKMYRNQLNVVMISLEDDENKWRQLLTKYNLFADGIVNYRIGSHSDLARKYNVDATPFYFMILKNGELFQNNRSDNAPLTADTVAELIHQNP